MNLITHDMLVQRAKKWLESQSGSIPFSCGIVLAEYRCWLDEIPDVIGFNGTRSILLECKISRTDFLNDKKKNSRQTMRSLGNYRYYFTLPNVCCAEEVPDDWGLLYVTNKRIVRAKTAPLIENDAIKATEWSILYSIARRAAIRGLLKELQTELPTKGVLNESRE